MDIQALDEKTINWIINYFCYRIKIPENLDDCWLWQGPKTTGAITIHNAYEAIRAQRDRLRALQEGK